MVYNILFLVVKRFDELSDFISLCNLQTTPSHYIDGMRICSKSDKSVNSTLVSLLRCYVEWGGKVEILGIQITASSGQCNNGFIDVVFGIHWRAGVNNDPVERTKAAS